MDLVEEYWMDPNSEDFSEHVVTMTHFDDPNQPYTCTQWAQQGSTSNNFMIDDGGGYFVHGMFNSGNAFPSNVWVDHNMTVYYKTNNTGYYLANLKLQDMLDDCEPCNNPDLDADGTNNDIDNCPNDYNPDQSDSDGDSLGDVCDDCHNMSGDVNDDLLVDVLDIVLSVNMILSGGINSSDFTDCETSDANIDGNAVINILDVIQIINMVIGGVARDDFSNSSAEVTYIENGDNLLINIRSQADVAGIQIDIENNVNYDIELVDNSHVKTWSANHDHNFTAIAFDELMLNRAFDSRNITFIINDFNSLDTNDISIVVASMLGEEVAVEYNGYNSNITNPEQYGLSKIYPNPFNPSTEVEFTLQNDAHVMLSVYDLNGRVIETIFEGFQTSGLHSYRWNASDVPSGVYYVKLQFENQAQTMKAVLVK